MKATIAAEFDKLYAAYHEANKVDEDLDLNQLPERPASFRDAEHELMHLK